MARGASTDTGTTTSSERVLVVANGQPPSVRFFAELQKQCDGLVCVDGGANWLCRSDAPTTLSRSDGRPLVVLGDGDSLTNATRDKLSFARFVSTPDQEHSDLDKALEHLISLGHARISVTGAMGRRVDHALANIGLLLKYRKLASITFHASSEDLFLLEGSWQAELRKSRRVSLLPMFGCAVITTSGLLYPLEREPLELGIRDGLSNSSLGGLVRVESDAPMLVCIERRRTDSIIFAPEPGEAS